MKFGDWWRQSAFAESHPDLYGICEAVWLASESYAVPEDELIDLLRDARDALNSCYDVQSYPGDGKTVQDGVISRLDHYLQQLPQSDTPK